MLLDLRFVSDLLLCSEKVFGLLGVNRSNYFLAVYLIKNYRHEQLEYEEEYFLLFHLRDWLVLVQVSAFL